MTKAIEMSRTYPYPRAVVWHALTDADALREWLMDNDFRLEVGHRFQFRDKPQGDWRGWMDCEVLAYEDERMLRLSWQGMPEHTVQTVTFTLEDAPGGTTLRLLHDDFDSTMGRFDGWMLCKILGFGWKRMFDKRLPTVLGFLTANPEQPVPLGLVAK
jgi:uncharacterized protein YndB with AHSA1/START domain